MKNYEGLTTYNEFLVETYKLYFNDNCLDACMNLELHSNVGENGKTDGVPLNSTRIKLYDICMICGV